jgi:hypothetical protein
MGAPFSKPRQGLTPLPRAVIDRTKCLQIEEHYADTVDEKKSYGNAVRTERDAKALDPQTMSLLIRQSLEDPKNK